MSFVCFNCASCAAFSVFEASSNLGTFTIATFEGVTSEKAMLFMPKPKPKANEHKAKVNKLKANLTPKNIRGAIEGLGLQAHLGKMEAKEALKNLPATVKANKKAIAGGAGAVGALAAAGVLGKRAIDARRKAKLMRRAGIGGAALAGLAGLGYAAHKARD